MIAPGLLAWAAAERVGGGIDRRQPDHLGGQAGIALDQFGLGSSLGEELGDEMHRHARAAERGIAAEDFGIGDDEAPGPA